MKKIVVALICLFSVTAGALAKDNSNILDNLLQAFSSTFPDARQVKWSEGVNAYSVCFKENDILIKIDYDKQGNFTGSVRYYTGKNLPVNILCKIQKKYADKSIFGVTEITTDLGAEYYVKLEGATNWVTVKTTSEGTMQVVEKYEKAPMPELAVTLSNEHPIIGSWHLSDMKGVATDKATGQKQAMSGEELKEMKQMMDYHCTFNADHSMIWRSSFMGGKSMELKGTYTLDGEKLTPNVAVPKQFKDAAGNNPMAGIPNYVIVRFDWGKMIWHFAVDLEDEGKTIHADLDWIWERK